MRRFPKPLRSGFALLALSVVLCACQHDQVASSGWKGPPEAQAVVIESIENAILARLETCTANTHFNTAYVPLVKVSFSRDGTMEEAPMLLNPPAQNKDKAVAEAALRISQSCDAVRDVKRYQKYYESWHHYVLRFELTGRARGGDASASRKSEAEHQSEAL